MTEETPRSLFDFAGADAAGGWLAVNDGVMGGVPEGGFRITDRKTLEFSGTHSLENNGGFASVRSRPAKLGWSPVTPCSRGSGATGGNTR